MALGVSEARMDQGSTALRREPLAVARRAPATLGTRTETKNVNSLRSVERAVRYEMQRHAAILDAGGTILQETRHWHEDTGITTSGREKSDAEDYRYFPEPDLVPVAPTPRVGRGAARHAARAAAGAPRPAAGRVGLLRPRHARHRRRRARSAWSRRPSPPAPARRAARKWWLGELARRANETGVDIADARRSRPADVAAVQALVDAGTINDKLARQVFEGVLAGEGTPDEVVAARGLAVVSDDGALGAAVDNAIAANPDVADKIRDGKVAAAGALIGAVMKEMRGQADAGRVRELILEKLT